MEDSEGGGSNAMQCGAALLGWHQQTSSHGRPAEAPEAAVIAAGSPC